MAWIPGEQNISDDVSRYSPSLEVYAASLAATFGQNQIPFIFAHPSATLVDGVTEPEIKNAPRLQFDQWPRDLESIAMKLGKLAAERVNLSPGKRKQ